MHDLPRHQPAEKGVSVKVTIGDDFLTVEDAPTPEVSGLTEQETGVLALVLALTWAVGRIAEAAQIAAEQTERGPAVH